MRAVYIGAGSDTLPIVLFRDITVFYYIDCMPNTYCGRPATQSKSDRLMKDLERNMSKIGMGLVSVDSDVRTYTNGAQTVVYFTNCSFPKDMSVVLPLIRDYDALIVCGYCPRRDVLNATTKPIRFIGTHTTCYDKNKPDDTVIADLNGPHAESVRTRFSSFELMHYADDATHKHDKHAKVVTTHGDWEAFIACADEQLARQIDSDDEYCSE